MAQIKRELGCLARHHPAQRNQTFPARGRHQYLGLRQLETGEHIVEPLPMPQPLVAWLENFIATHHEEETFIKRQRDKLDLENEKFGQEPLEVIRERQKRH